MQRTKNKIVSRLSRVTKKLQQYYIYRTRCDIKKSNIKAIKQRTCIFFIALPDVFKIALHGTDQVNNLAIIFCGISSYLYFCYNKPWQTIVNQSETQDKQQIFQRNTMIKYYSLLQLQLGGPLEAIIKFVKTTFDTTVSVRNGGKNRYLLKIALHSISSVQISSESHCSNKTRLTTNCRGFLSVLPLLLYYYFVL